jgi:hypothetical protein
MSQHKEAILQSIIEVTEFLTDVVQHLNLVVANHNGEEIGCWENAGSEEAHLTANILTNVTCSETDFSVIRTLKHALSAFSESCVSRIIVPDALIIIMNPENEVDSNKFTKSDSFASIELKRLSQTLKLRNIQTQIVNYYADFTKHLLNYLPNCEAYSQQIDASQMVNSIVQNLPVCRCE